MTETLISSSVLIILVIILRYILRRKIPNCAIYSLWLIVAVRLMMPSGLSENAVSIMNFQKYGIEKTGKSSAITAKLSDIISESYTSENGDIKTDTAIPDISEIIHGTDTISLHNVLNIIWISGMCIFFLWFFVSDFIFYLRLCKKRIKYELECDISVYVTENINSPCIFGVFRPSIYLSKSATEQKRSLEYIISHELCHYRHGDLIWSIVRYILVSVWWFNPLVWVGAYLSKQDCEYACDESVIKKLCHAQRIEYGRVLLLFAVMGHSESPFSIASSMTSNGKRLKKRIVLIAEKQKKSALACIITVILTSVAVVCTFTSAETSHEMKISENTTNNHIHIRDPAETEYRPEESNDDITTHYEESIYSSVANDLYFYATYIYFGIVEKGDLFTTNGNILDNSGVLYEEIFDDNISTMDDLKKFVRNYFSEPLASQYDSMIEQNYIEHYGKLYQHITEEDYRADSFSVEFLYKAGDEIYFNAIHNDPYNTDNTEKYVRFVAMIFENGKWKISKFNP